MGIKVGVLIVHSSQPPRLAAEIKHAFRQSSLARVHMGQYAKDCLFHSQVILRSIKLYLLSYQEAACK
jgi:hypothetical protein